MTKVMRILSLGLVLLITQFLLVSSITQGIVFTNEQNNPVINSEDDMLLTFDNEFTETKLQTEESFIDSLFNKKVDEKNSDIFSSIESNLDIDPSLITIDASLENYVMDDTHPYSWIDATGGIMIPLGDDDAIPIGLPFLFEFYDAIFDTVYISSNGWLSFTNSYPNWIPDPYPNTFPDQQYSIAPFGTDLYPSDNIYVWIEPDMIVIEYFDINFFGGAYAGTFEVILYDTGEIVFQYLYIDDDYYPYVCGLNYGLDPTYYNAYYGITAGTNNLAISFNIIQEDHDLSVSLEAPYSLEPSESTLINATVTNNGLFDEVDVVLSILIDEVVVATQLYPTLFIDASETLQYLWAPIVDDSYNITAYAVPVPGETYIVNNQETRNCTVIAKTWTIIYYLDGDVNLEHLAIEDFNELERGIAATPMVNILVLFDRHPGYDSSNGDWTSTRLYEVLPDFSSTIQSNLLIDYDELNMGDPTTLSDFISYCFQNYPAENYMLNLWDHGGGINGICWDETNGNDYLTMDELQSAIALSEGLYGEKIDITSFVACLMNMLEISYELRDLTDYLIASEEVMYNQVVDWEDVLNRFGANPLMLPDQFANEIVDSYAQDWASEFIATQFSAIDVSVINSIDVYINDFASILETIVIDGYASEIASSLSSTQAFYYPQYIDLIHFIEQIIANTFLISQYPALLTYANDLLLELNNAVINNFQHADFYGNANGISIFMPYDYNAHAGIISDYISAINDYAGLDWLANCYWDEFLDTLYTTGYLMAYNIEWVFPTGGEVFSSPAFFDVDRDRNPEIFFGSYDGYLYCLDNTGSIVWSVDIGIEIASSPTIADLNNDHHFEILIGAEDGYLYCFDEDGVYLWSYNTGDIIHPNTAGVADINNDGYLEIVITSLNGIHCLDYLGNQEWTYALGLESYANPIFADVNNNGYLEVLLGDESGYFYCIDKSGVLLWQYDTFSMIASTAAVADLDEDGTLEIVLGTLDSEVICLDHLGSLEWTADFYAMVMFTSIIIADIDNDGHLDIIYGAENYVVCLDHTGSMKWYFTTAGFFAASPVLADLTNDGELEVIIGSYDGNLYCLESDGTLMGSIFLGGMIYSSALVLDVDNDGSVELILGTMSFDLVCIDLPDLGLTGDTPYYCLGGSIFRTGSPDSDGDYIDDLTEDFYGIDPTDTDSDNDGLTDWEELLYYLTDPSNADTDGDGLDDGDELFIYGTDPNDSDTDDDTMPDGWEVDNGLDPLVDDSAGDPDSDGLTNADEYAAGTDPNNPDTDGDGLTDGEEINTHDTDPLDTDSDDDTILDGEEVVSGTDGYVTNPNDADTDGDGIDDADEITNGTDPTDPNDPPPDTTTTTTETGIELLFIIPTLLISMLGLIIIRKNRK